MYGPPGTTSDDSATWGPWVLYPQGSHTRALIVEQLRARAQRSTWSPRAISPTCSARWSASAPAGPCSPARRPSTATGHWIQARRSSPASSWSLCAEAPCTTPRSTSSATASSPPRCSSPVRGPVLTEIRHDRAGLTADVVDNSAGSRWRCPIRSPRGRGERRGTRPAVRRPAGGRSRRRSWCTRAGSRRGTGRTIRRPGRAGRPAAVNATPGTITTSGHDGSTSSSGIATSLPFARHHSTNGAVSGSPGIVSNTSTRAAATTRRKRPDVPPDRDRTLAPIGHGPPLLTHRAPQRGLVERRSRRVDHRSAAYIGPR